MDESLYKSPCVDNLWLFNAVSALQRGMYTLIVLRASCSWLNYLQILVFK